MQGGTTEIMSQGFNSEMTANLMQVVSNLHGNDVKNNEDLLPSAPTHEITAQTLDLFNQNERLQSMSMDVTEYE